MRFDDTHSIDIQARADLLRPIAAHKSIADPIPANFRLWQPREEAPPHMCESERPFIHVHIFVISTDFAPIAPDPCERFLEGYKFWILLLCRIGIIQLFIRHSLCSFEMAYWAPAVDHSRPCVVICVSVDVCHGGIHANVLSANRI